MRESQRSAAPVRVLNVKALVIFLVSVVAIGGGLFGLHYLQVRRSFGMMLAQGDKAEADGKLDVAIRSYKHCVGLHPKDVVVRGKLADVLAKAAKTPAEKRDAANMLRSVTVDDPSKPERLIKAGNLFNEVGLFDEAQPIFERAVKDKPTDAEAKFQLAIATLGKNELDRGNQEIADKLLEEAAKTDPKFLKAYVTRAALLRRRKGNDSTADLVMDQMVSNNRDNAEAYVARAAHRLQGGSPKAADDIREALRLKPDHADIPLLVAQQALREGKPEDAEKALRDAIAKQPSNVGLVKYLARMLASSGKSAEAVDYLQKAQKDNPNDKDLAWQLADNQIQAGQLKEAEAMIGLLEAEKLPEGTINFLQGTLAVKRNEWDKGMTLFEKATRNLTGFPEIQARAYVSLGICQERLNALVEALASYEAAAKIAPDWKQATNLVAATQAKLGRVNDAIKTARFQKGSNRAAQAGLQIISTLQMPESKRNWREAELLVDMVDAEEKGSLEAYMLKADLFAAQDKLDESRKVLLEAQAKYPKRIDTWLGLSNVATREGKLDEAWDLLNKAPGDKDSAASIRLAKIDNIIRRGGDKMATELLAQADKIESFTKRDQLMLRDALTTSLLKIGKVDEAAAQLAEYIKLEPDSIRPRTLMIETARLQKNEAKMTEAIGELRRVEGERGITWRLIDAKRLIAKASAGDRTVLTDARRALSDINTLRPSEPELVRLNAEIEVLENRGDQAISAMKLAIEQGQRDPRTIQRLIQMLADQGRYQEADKTIRDLELKAPLDSQTKRLAAELALRSNNRVRAAELIRSAVPIATPDAESQLWRGQMILFTDNTPGARTEAEAAFRQALKLEPSNPVAWLSLVELLTGLQRRDEAVSALAKGLTQVPADAKLLLEAQGNEAIGRLDLAKAAYEKALAEAPNNRAVMRTAALFFQKIEQFRKAEILLRRLVELGTQLTPAEMHTVRISLATLLGRTGKPSDTKEAIALIDENLKSRPGSIRDLRVKIDILSQHPESRRQAIDAFKTLEAAREPLSVSDRTQLAQLYVAEGLWDAAKKEMQNLLVSSNNDSNALGTYIQMLLARNNPADVAAAAPLVDMLIAKEPNSFNVIELKARVLAAQKNPKAVVELLDGLAKSKPQLLPNVAIVYERLEMFDSAEAAYRSVAANPATPQAKLVLARYLGRRNKHKEALELCEAARKTTPAEEVAATIVLVLDNVKRDKALNEQGKAMLKSILAGDPALRSSGVPLIIAVVATRLDQFDEAIGIYNDILKEKPNSVGPLNNMAWLLALRGQGDKAMPMISQVIKEFGPSPKFLDTRGVAELAVGRKAEAIDDFRDSIAGRPDDLPAVFYHFAAALYANGEKSDAKQALERGQRLGLTADYLEPIEIPAYEKLVKDLKDVK